MRKNVLQVVFVLIVALGLFALSESGCIIVPLGSRDPLQEQQDWHDRLHRSFAEKNPDLIDPWGTPARIKEEGATRRTTSAGPDRTFDTRDDLPYTSERL
jgi:hypothetical protein